MRNFIAATLLCSSFCHAQPTPDPILEARVKALSAELRCLVCQNQTVEDSSAPVARDMKDQVRAQLAAGKSEADCIVPVPLSAGRLRERGYNHALEIARQVARATGKRLAPELCERRRDTPPQIGLPLAERAKNVRGAFHCPQLVGGARIAVLDDVMTTGATLDEIAATLKRAGAARVENWVVARTFPPGPAP